MIAIIWTREGCGACLKEKYLLKAEGYRVEEIAIHNESEMDRLAFAQLHLQDGMFPVVKVGEDFRTPAGIAAKMDWNA